MGSFHGFHFMDFVVRFDSFDDGKGGFHGRDHSRGEVLFEYPYEILSFWSNIELGYLYLCWTTLSHHCIVKTPSLAIVNLVIYLYF